MQVKDLTINELKDLIRATILETLEEFLPDPDEGQTVKESFKQELLEARQRRESGVPNFSSEEVMQKLGLK